MKWVTVQEYAAIAELSLAGAYKQIKEKRVRSERKYGKLVVAINDNQKQAVHESN